MKKKGFFPQNKITMLFLVIILAVDVTMFMPGIVRATTELGTSIQYIFVNVILFMAPSLALVDGIIKSAKEKKANAAK